MLHFQVSSRLLILSLMMHSGNEKGKFIDNSKLQALRSIAYFGY